MKALEKDRRPAVRDGERPGGRRAALPRTTSRCWRARRRRGTGCGSSPGGTRQGWWSAAGCCSCTVLLGGGRLGQPRTGRAGGPRRPTTWSGPWTGRTSSSDQGKRAEALAALDRAELLAGEARTDANRVERLAALKERLDGRGARPGVPRPVRGSPVECGKPGR